MAYNFLNTNKGIMAKDTPSMAKNKIRRCFQAIIDPHPTKIEVDSLWMYFDSSCAYCGTTIERNSRVGHVDHIVSSAAGGSNNIHNHVLSCARCNGDEKRENPWRQFLASKADTSSQQFKVRVKKIEDWLQMEDISEQMDSRSLKEADEILNIVIHDFDHAVKKLRALRKKGC